MQSQRWLYGVMAVDSRYFSPKYLPSKNLKYRKILKSRGLLSIKGIELAKYTFKNHVETYKGHNMPNFHSLCADQITKETLTVGGSTVNALARHKIDMFKTALQRDVIQKVMLASSAVEPEMYTCVDDSVLDRPLCDFLMASSHNTYLVMKQYGGHALADPYR